MKQYIFKRIYWVALFEVRVMQLLGMPKSEYSWWKSRLNLIKQGKINKGE